MRIMITLNGRAMVTASVWIADSPPASSSAAASAAVASVKNTRIQLRGSASPPVASMAMTSDPESDEVMKKIAESTIAPTTSTPPAGSCSSTWKSAEFASTAPPAPITEVYPAGRNISLKIAVPPSTPNHTNVTSVGTRMTPRMNSRTVRPREMRAMKTPTNGAQLIHQPQ